MKIWKSTRYFYIFICNILLPYSSQRMTKSIYVKNVLLNRLRCLALQVNLTISLTLGVKQTISMDKLNLFLILNLCLSFRWDHLIGSCEPLPPAESVHLLTTCSFIVVRSLALVSIFLVTLLITFYDWVFL